MSQTGKTVVITGMGNIGSFLVLQMALMPGVKKLILIDKDHYDEGNLKNQAIVPRDVGKTKVEVQAEKIRKINPDLDVEVICDDVQNVPLGLLRCDCILGCVDNESTRQWISSVARKLGIHYFDAGVKGDGGESLVRVTLFMPDEESPCIECSWSPEKYKQLETAYPCQGGAAVAPTNASALLGNTAAILLAAECAKLLNGRMDLLFPGRQIIFDTNHHRYIVSRLVRNPHCRLNHRAWDISQLDQGPDHITLGQALELASKENINSVVLSLPFGRPFYRGSYQCRRCGHLENLFSRGAEFERRVCERCGVENEMKSLQLVPQLKGENLSDAVMQRPLDTFDLRGGDLFVLDDNTSGRRYYQINV